MFYLKNPNTKQPDVTLTFFTIGFFVALAKLIFSGIQIMNYVKVAQFSGTEFAAVVASLGALHVYSSISNNQGGPSVS